MYVCERVSVYIMTCRRFMLSGSNTRNKINTYAAVAADEDQAAAEVGLQTIYIYSIYAGYMRVRVCPRIDVCIIVYTYIHGCFVTRVIF